MATIYATQEQVEDFMDVLLFDPSVSINRLLARASDLVRQVMWKNYNPNNAMHVEAAMNATCAQVEFWVKHSEDVNIGADRIVSYSAGSTSATFESGIAIYGEVCKRGRGYLAEAGLLYRGL
jgi:hypothetical protein